MSYLNYSIASLLGLVAFIALACVAVMNASPFWVRVTFSLALGATLVAVVGIVYRRNRTRAFWLGFLVFGGGYLLLSGPWFSSIARPHLLTSELTSNLYDKVRRLKPKITSGDVVVHFSASGRVFVNDEEIEPEQIPDKLGNTPASGVYVYEDDPTAQLSDPDYVQMRSRFWTGLFGRYTSAQTASGESVSFPKRTDFEAVCHSVLSFMFGLLGGLVARRFQSTKEQEL